MYLCKYGICVIEPARYRSALAPGPGFRSGCEWQYLELSYEIF